MGILQQGIGFHYGLDYVLSHNEADIADVVDRLEKRNRGRKATIEAHERPALHRQLQARMKVRRRKAAARRRRYYK